ITETVFEVWSAVYTRSPATEELVAPKSENAIAQSFIVTSPFGDSAQWVFRAISAWRRFQTVDRRESPAPVGASPDSFRRAARLWPYRSHPDDVGSSWTRSHGRHFRSLAPRPSDAPCAPCFRSSLA